jgi:hypothetical protein
MSRRWWSLPGPRAYLDRVARDLEAGRSIVCHVPAHGPDDLGDAIRRTFEQDWRVLDTGAANDGAPVADRLLARFEPERPARERRDVRAVVASMRLRGHALLLEIEAAAGDWPGWCAFLDEYAELARALEAFERTVFCVVLTGSGTPTLPPVSVCVAHHPLRGYVSELDVHLYVAQRIAEQRAHSRSRLVGRVRQTVAARVAGSDRALAIRLADAPLDVLLQPAALLASVAAERGWGADALEDPAAWAAGASDELDGEAAAHSAALVTAGRGEEVEARVWAGQVAVLFPFLEAERRRWLERYGHRLTVPFTLGNGHVVTDRRDMELAHIHWQLRRAGTAVSRADLDALYSLAGMRNHLAHWEVVPAERLEDPALRAVLG